MDWEHRLVFVFPTALYFLSILIKAIIVNQSNKLTERKTDERTAEELKHAFFKDFIVIVSWESIFLSMANGFIMIVEFNLAVIGDLLLCSGILISVLLIFSPHVENDFICVASLFGIFLLKFFDVLNFIFLEIGEYFKFWTILGFLVISLVFGFIFVLFIIYRVMMTKKEKEDIRLTKNKL